MKIRVTFILIILLCIVSAAAADDRYRIRIGSRSLLPERSVMAAEVSAGQFFIMQFHRLPDEGERATMSASGIEFHRYVGGSAWLVRRSGAAAPAAMEESLVRATVPYDVQMKRSPLFAEDRLLRSALNRGERVRAQVRFFPGVSREQALALVATKGIPVRAAFFGYGRSLAIECTAAELDDLLREETVELVDPGLPESKEFNIDAASRTGADDVRRRAPFRNSDGSSIRIGVWDGGPIKVHTDFQDRVTIIENTSASDHATHVAGTVAGAGLLNGNALGMAPAARIWSWNFNGDVVSEKAAGIAAYGLRITTNSWGTISGWDSDTNEDDSIYWRWVGDWMFGVYHDSAASLDALIRERDILIVFAAGNDRGEHYLGPHYHNFDKTITYNDTHVADPQYRSIPTWGNAKNNLTVGATHKDDVITSFSCWGPTGDGRLKPDVVAPGYGLFSTYADNGYAKASGTSMATPVVSGLAALLADYHQRRHGTEISGLALKTLLIHSARDLGVAGPDFTYGHGMVDGELAARVLRTAVFKAANFGVQPKPKVDRDADMSSMIIEDSVSQGGFKVYKISVPEGRAELRATLVWFDPAGEGLINNLDLSLKRKGQPLARPYVLNPANPVAAAVTGINNRDTAESVILWKAPGGMWRVYVRGAAVPQGPQRFCLIVSAGDGNEPPALLKNNTFTLMKVHPSSDSNWDAVNEKTVFSTGDDLWFYTYITVSENATYDGWYGTLLETWRVKNAAGETVFETYYSHDGFYPRPNYWRWRLGPYDVPSGMARGNYTLEVAVTSFTGETQTASCTFTVQ